MHRHPAPRRCATRRSVFAAACPSLLLGLAAAVPALAVDLQGHRGARGLAPESTLVGFDTALRVGVTTLEMDTVVTADGVVVVHHDRRLNPDHTRDARGEWIAAPGPVIHRLRVAELAAFDVGRARPGSRTAAQHPEQQPADGQRIPTLAEVLARAKATAPATLRFNIETKLSPLAPDEGPSPQAFVQALLAVVRTAGVEDRVTIQSFDWRTLREVQRVAPAIPTAYLTSQQDWGPGVDDGVWTAGFTRRDHGSVPRMVAAAGGRVWSPFFGDLTADALREARSLGLQVSVWTVNEPVHLERMLDLGVDALITDRPDRARRAMAARGLPLPAPVSPPAAGR